MNQRINITWTDEHERLAEQVVKKFAGRMGELGINVRANRSGREKDFNHSGAILMALMLAAGEVSENHEGKDEVLPLPIPGSVLADRIEAMDFSPEDIEAFEAGIHESRQVDHARW